MAEVNQQERLGRMQAEAETLQRLQGALMEANRTLESLGSIGGLSPAEAGWMQKAQLANWTEAMVAEGMLNVRMAQLRQAMPPAEPEAEDEVPVPEQTAAEPEAEGE